MRQNLSKPCTECPFRKIHPSGWLGPYQDPRQLIVLADFDTFPCHRTMKNGKVIEDMEACAGAAHFCANRLSIPRDPSLAEARKRLGKSGDVFSSTDEFITHHESTLGIAQHKEHQSL